MKIQCNCGAKFSFDATPEMAAQPVKFTCQQCGADNSAAVNSLIQQQFPEAAAASPANVPETIPTAAVTSSRLTVKVAHAAPAEAPGTSDETSAPEMCRKHPGHFSTEHCRVCGKPICPQCMVLFGYVCSAYCKNEAETRGLALPVYARQAGVAARRETRKLGRLIFGLIAVILLLLGVYIWYLAAGSRPHVVFAAQFKEPAYRARGKLFPHELVVLHGGQLARYDWKTKKQLWAVDLVDAKEIDTQADAAMADENAAVERWKKEGGGDYAPRRHSKEELVRMLATSAQSDVHLHIHEETIWLQSPGKLTAYDWAGGKAGKEIPLPGYVERTAATPDALLIFAASNAGEELLKVDWKSGETQTRPLGARPVRLAQNSAPTNALTARRTTPGDPTLQQFKVAQPDSLQTRIAAPAIVANAVQNRRINRALAEDDEAPALKPAVGGAEPMLRRADAQFLNDRGNVVEFSSKLLEEKIATRQAMKAPPKKSALDGPVNQAATMAVANELMNEFQRDSTGGVEHEDVSKYEVTIRRLGPEAAESKMEVTGPPQFFPLETVDLLVAGTTLTVLDKTEKKLWESQLNFRIAGGFGPDTGEGELVAQASAPAVERAGLLYFFDRGVLACFDLGTGQARWRQPTVGVTKILFDDQGVLYADTTTGSADRLRYSQQVDLSDKSYPVILKLDPKTGKILWRSERHGRLSRVFGNLVYTLEWHGGEDEDEPTTILPGTYMPPHIRLRRLSARNGEVKWEYYQKRAPLALDIQNNTIALVFKKEVQVLKFIGL